MAKLVSQPYEFEEERNSDKLEETVVASPAVGLVGIIIIVMLLAGALFLVYGALGGPPASVR